MTHTRAARNPVLIFEATAEFDQFCSVKTPFLLRLQQDGEQGGRRAVAVRAARGPRRSAGWKEGTLCPKHGCQGRGNALNSE